MKNALRMKFVSLTARFRLAKLMDIGNKVACWNLKITLKSTSFAHETNSTVHTFFSVVCCLLEIRSKGYILASFSSCLQQGEIKRGYCSQYVPFDI